MAPSALIFCVNQSEMKILLLFFLEASLQFSLPFSVEKTDQCLGDLDENPSYKMCEEKANSDFYDCVFECSPNDSVCRSECNRDLVEQTEKCPCKVNLTFKLH